VSGPHSREAEQNVLGALLLDNSQWGRISPPLEETHFVGNDHVLIFQAIRDLLANDRPADPLTVHEHLNRGGELENAGGLAYLSSLARNTASPTHAPEYANILRSDAAASTGEAGRGTLGSRWLSRRIDLQGRGGTSYHQIDARHGTSVRVAHEAPPRKPGWFKSGPR
jgi:hypothetical protein